MKANTKRQEQIHCIKQSLCPYSIREVELRDCGSVIVHYINQVKPITNGMDNLFSIPNSKIRNYINSIKEKYGLIFMI